MKRVAWLGTLLVSLSFQINSSLASDAEYRWDWTLSSQSMQPRDSLYTAPADSAQQINAMLDLEINKESWTGLFAVKADNLYSSESTSRDSTFIISELFYQGEFQIGSENMEYQLGKVRQDWGVGYGYRPLDILKPFRRNPVGIQVEEGTGLLSLSRFDMNGEWTLFYSDSSWNSQDGNEIEQQSEQQGFGVRRYLLSGNSEYQALAYYDDVRHGLLGASFITVPDIAWELHGSLTWQQRHLAYKLPNENTKPVSLDQHGSAWQALAGFTWTSNTGHQLISEYWYDSRSWHRSDWQLAHQRTEDLAQQPAFDSLRYSYANGFNHINLMAHNLMLHWSLDTTAWSTLNTAPDWISDVTPTMDLLYSPQDSGVIGTWWLNYELHNSGNSSIELGLAARFFTGESDSVYANLPNKHMILFDVKGRF
ncbi:hypothetical protein [Vibrio sp. 99-8-1]|uniref:hypothetical protein n=1 Tax=Vibrio sp. 99-8-1 TaxID=2607602 RepID=UPI0014937698|nr:hypothetical protein [Vibrio sp. 99-8-1]NOI66456.1 hypothetical protein [Vibrio sp. 99-8-1]